MLGDDLNELSHNFNLDTLPEEFGGQCQSYNGHCWTSIMTSKESKETAPTLTESLPAPKLRLETEI